MTWDAFPDELAALSEALRRFTETERTADAISGLSGALTHSWRTKRMLSSGHGIPIPPPRAKALFPRNCEVTEAELTFVFKLGDGIEQDIIPAQSDFQVCVNGLVLYDAACVELEDHWRVDTHVHTQGPSPLEPHPLVHFQRGGHAQDRFEAQEHFIPGANLPTNEKGSWFSLLQSPGPRVPFPPFCPVLAIDYTIGQHDGSLLRKLRSLPEYSAVVLRAQRRLWSPFFNALASDGKVRKRWLGDLILAGV